MEELRLAIQKLAKEYWNETGDGEMTAFPMSVVRFVIEYAINNCHFPENYSNETIVEIMNKFQSSLAMACVDVYNKAGAEGEKSHSENGVARTYSDSYIDKNLLSSLPNFVRVV